MTQAELLQLQNLDFTGKGEAFVEANFLTPLLRCLGYEAHEDYEVRRHGDDGASFKLKYPPVEKGAQRVKEYNPDYIPTIRKKMFWVVEAKSPKTVAHPFEAQYLVQGLQYCIHPEIQAKYLVVTNGADSSVFDAHSSVFLGKDIYEPILEFKASELIARWPEIYELLSVEKLRTRIEVDLKAMYDKLCLSSLDKDYPHRLLKRIGEAAGKNAQAIAKKANALYVEGMKKQRVQWAKEMEQANPAQILLLMDLPMPPGQTQAQYFVNKSLASGAPARDILAQLISNFERQSIFRKEQTFVAVCSLYPRIDDPTTKAAAKSFLENNKDAELPLLNQVECAYLRVCRKIIVLNLYPPLRQRITDAMKSAPELVRFVDKPSAFSITYPAEVELHHRIFEDLKRRREEDFPAELKKLLQIETSIQKDFSEARTKLSDSEHQIGGFEGYGEGGRHYAFKNIMANFGITE